MAENMMNSEHKTNSDLYKKNWERIFGEKGKGKDDEKTDD